MTLILTFVMNILTIMHTDGALDTMLLQEQHMWHVLASSCMPQNMGVPRLLGIKGIYKATCCSKHCCMHHFIADAGQPVHGQRRTHHLKALELEGRQNSVIGFGAGDQVMVRITPMAVVPECHDWPKAGDESHRLDSFGKAMCKKSRHCGLSCRPEAYKV